jgi:hypothetical protein
MTLGKITRTLNKRNIKQKKTKIKTEEKTKNLNVNKKNYGLGHYGTPTPY